jgi:hypothetical protein
MTNLPLLLGLLFTWLWYRTPAGVRYETVELEPVSARRVYLILAMVCIGAWLLLPYPG